MCCFLKISIFCRLIKTAFLFLFFFIFCVIGSGGPHCPAHKIQILNFVSRKKEIPNCSRLFRGNLVFPKIKKWEKFGLMSENVKVILMQIYTLELFNTFKMPILVDSVKG